MAGTLKVGGVPIATHSDATAKVTLDSGLMFPAGHVIQVSHGYDTNQVTFSAGDSGYVELLTVSITPKNLTSNFLVSISLTAKAQDSRGSAYNDAAEVKISRTQDAVSTNIFERNVFSSLVNADPYIYWASTNTVLDSPSLTSLSQIDYKLEFKGAELPYDSVTVYGNVSPVTLTVMEISA